MFAVVLLALLGGAVAWQYGRHAPAQPPRSRLRLHENVMEALQDSEIVRTTEVLDPGTPRGQAQTFEVDRRQRASSSGMLSRPAWTPPLAWLVGHRPGFRLDVLEPEDRELRLQIANGMTAGAQRVMILFNGHALDGVDLPPPPAPPAQPEPVTIDLKVPRDIQIVGSNRVELLLDGVQMRQLADEPVELPLAAILTHVRFARRGHLEDPPPEPRAAGLITEVTGEQSRAALLLPPGTVARVPLQLPAAPRVVLRFEAERIGSTLDVSLLTDAGMRMRLGRIESTDPASSEIRFDLTPWAGEPVLLEFLARPAGETAPPGTAPPGTAPPAPPGPAAPAAAAGGDETRLAVVQILVPEDWMRPAVRGAGRPEAPAAAPGSGLPSPAASRPSFLVITLDALAREAAEAHASGGPVMPNLAALLARGVAFTEATAPASYTLASVGSLLTGQNPITHGVALDHDARGVLCLRPDAPHLAAALRGQGWRTAAFMTNPNTAKEHGYAEGFDLYDELFAPDKGLWVDAKGVAGSHLPARLETFLQQSAGAPFLAWVHIFEPHADYDAPHDLQARYVPPYTGDVTGQRAWIDDVKNGRRTTDAAGWQHLRELYTARTALADRVLGELLAALDRSGRAGDTVIVVLSDHGEAFGDHGAVEHGDNVYHEQVDVPLVFIVPGRKPERLPGPATLIDVAPTLLALAGLPAPAGMQGVDLLAGAGTGSASEGALDPQRPLLTRNADRLPVLGWTRGGLRLVASLATRRRELYDLEHDPDELINLCDSRPVTAALFYRELCHAVCAAEAAASAPVPAHPANDVLDPLLPQIGYVSTKGTAPEAGAASPDAAPLPLGALMRSTLTRL